MTDTALRTQFCAQSQGVGMVYCIVDKDTGERIVVGTGPGEITIPRYLPRPDLPPPPLDLAEVLCAHANRTEHHSAGYDAAMGLDLSDRMAEYERLYRDVCDLDVRLKNIMPVHVVEESVLSVSILARKPG